MDDAERRVAIAHGLREDAQGGEVVDLLQLDLLFLQFLRDAVQALRAALDPDDGNLRLLQLRGKRPPQLLEDGFGRLASRLHARAERFVDFGSRYLNASSSSSFFTLLIPSRLAIGA